ncbi:MAG TPA: cation:proton antiporter [Kofleriaceae bacterium]|nr:cation:proton antiporter [Kofleriaceae bacterium]
MSGDVFVAGLAVVGTVIVLSTLLSGAIERIGVPHIAVFLLFGAALGPSGLAIFGAGLDSPILRVVSTLSLVLVLFTDAMTLDLAEVRRHLGLAVRMLGPGTVVSAALIAAAGWLLLDLPVAGAAVLGAALASTDPVLLRGLLRRPELPDRARLALRLESGLNDVVLLPIVMVALPFLLEAGDVSVGRAALNMFALGPLAGVLVGLVGVALLDLVRRRVGVRRDYESIYSLGVAFAAFAAAESVHGSGFLAAFAAGMTIVWFDVELCDCFVEYGETTGEMLLLFTFVLLGTGPIWDGLDAIDGATMAFAAVALAVRPAVTYVSLLGSGLSGRERLVVAWYGPRGLSSLLLVLLAVFAGAPGAIQLFEVSCLVVLASVVVHGGSLTVVAWRGKATAPRADSDGENLITLDELARLEAAGESIVIADVRTARSVRESRDQAAGAVRIEPEDPEASAERQKLPRTAWIALYCA